MHPARQDLAKLPRVETHDLRRRALDRRFHDHRGRAMAAGCRPAVHQPLHVRGQPGHIERAVLHAHVDVIGPGCGVLAALYIRQHMARVVADIVQRLALRQ